MAVTCTYVGETSSTSNASTYTFSAQGISTAASDRIVVVGAHQRTGASPNTASTSITFDGNAGTIAGTAQIEASVLSEIYYRGIATGTTSDIVINCGEAQERAAIGVWAVYGAESTPTDTDGAVFDGTTISLSALTVPTDGCGIFASTATNIGAGAITWTNASERYEDYVESAASCSGADTTTAGTNTITAAGGPSRARTLVGVAFGPAAAGGARTDQFFVMF